MPSLVGTLTGNYWLMGEPTWPGHPSMDRHNDYQQKLAYKQTHRWYTSPISRVSQRKPVSG